MKAKVKPTTGDNIVEIVNVTRYYPESFHPSGYQSDVNYWIDKSLNLVYDEEDLEFDFDNAPIDWEQRRYEIARNFTTQMSANFMGNPDVDELSGEQIGFALSSFCTVSIQIADLLIRQLKGGVQ